MLTRLPFNAYVSFESARTMSTRMQPRQVENWGENWVLVLAGGEGSRLRSLTTRDGVAVPKQYCSLAGEQTLLDDAIGRSACVVDRDHVCVIVAAQHRQWWAPLLEDLPPENVIVQPRNLGTGIGMMFSAAHIAARDPNARIVALPADHYVGDEEILCRSMRSALAAAERDPRHLILLGIEPDHVDCELGYLAPGKSDGYGLSYVDRFIEKPDETAAAELIRAGALWNTFILASGVQAVLDSFCPRYAFAVLEMEALLAREQGTRDWAALVSLYERLPSVDFSHDVLAARQHELRVHSVPSCGWSDLGTPQRVAQTLAALPFEHRSRNGRAPFINLASQQALLGVRLSP